MKCFPPLDRTKPAFHRFSGADVNPFWQVLRHKRFGGVVGVKQMQKALAFGGFFLP
jgi:hypothetical protein